MSKEIRFKGIVATLAQIAADAFAGRISWASDLARPVHYYTDSDYAVLARKDVAETFPGIVNASTVGVGIRPKVSLADGTDAVQDAATFRGTIGAQHRNEAVNVTVTYPGPNSGYFLLGTTAEAAIPASRLVEGLVVRIKALADVSVDSGVYFSLIGALSNASTGVYPDTYDSASFGGPIGRWPGFLSGKILFTVEIRLGAITSGTTRLVHYVWSAQADGLAPIFWADGNYPLDVSIPRYPHLAVDLSGNGSINKYVYSVEIQDP